MDRLTVELVSIIVVLLGGFGTLIFQIGRWHKLIEDVEVRLTAHEKHCVDREKEIRDRLERGGKNIAVLQGGQEHIKGELKEIKGLLKDQK